MVTDAPTLMMLRSHHRWRLQDFRPAAMFLMMIEKEELLKAGVDDSGENEKAEEALTRGPEDCHLRHPRPNIRTCPILSIMFSLGLGVPIQSLIAIKSPAEIATSPSDAKESSC